ncbi:MAG: hypothetical protein WC044_00130 [Crocinitomicaceae bacterium]
MKQFQYLLVTVLFVALYSVALGFAAHAEIHVSPNKETALKNYTKGIQSVSIETVVAQIEVINGTGQNHFPEKTPNPTDGFSHRKKIGAQSALCRFNQYAFDWQNQLILLSHSDQLFPHHHFW